MKKFFATILLSLSMFACDWGTNPKTPDPIIIHDTVKVPDTTHKKITLKDTTIKFSARMQIVGKVQEKNSTGNIKGGFAAVVCLEKAGNCVKTNSKGEYAFIKSSQNFAGRSFSNDTLITPETVIYPVFKNDTLVKYDTIIRNDTTFIFYNMYVDTNYAFTDSVNIYSGSRLIMEIPVTSWKSILPDAYVVQRNISGNIIQNNYKFNLKQIENGYWDTTSYDYFKDLKSVECVYWNTDSVAIVIPLELSNNKLTYSGFVYQPYNDSSFITGNRVNNIFVRAIDNTDSVFGITSILTYSERSGDLNSVEDLILGAIEKYPKPSYFRVIKDGDNISRIITNTNSQIFYNPNGYDLDSLWVKPQFKKAIRVDNLRNETSEFYYVDQTTAKIFDLSKVDSIGWYFESDSTFSTNIKFSPDDFDYTTNNRNLNIVPGKNLFKFKFVPSPVDGIKSQLALSMVLNSVAVKNLKTIVWFK